DLDVSIDGIDLVLPTIAIADGAPAVTRDERIILQDKPKVEKPEPKDGAAAFRYKIRVQTMKSDSIQIHSNLAKTPVPIAVKVELNHNKPVSGEVRVDNFKVELLRRKAELKYFKLQIAELPEDQTIDGVVVFPNNDYRITLKIFGSAAFPEYTFESEPPLAQDQLMAVLLFGKLPDSLDGDDQKTAEETRAAVADGAVNLLSMYYLAATPIESVGYNPHSGVFSAKVSLQDGLSMTVGTDTENQREVGLRRRLGGGWSVETMAISNEETSSRKGVAMLRWGKRY
ncbi:translocation/assembly module TamB, partial [Oligoflexaceae bacterium]|nr:translocation/assembly module TamB [Oligoflexaceae bacterium]